MAATPHSPSSRPSGPELTWTAVILGLLLSVIMGAANVYLGLKAGLTVSASIPAAVISMGILQGIFRRRSILESNLVQTSASAGESLAAGIIFTMPALLLVGVWDEFQYWPVTLVALTGGSLGVLLMIPMRRVFVVQDKELKFPEGVACAEVLWAGQAATGESDSAKKGVRLVAGGIVIGAVFQFAQRFLGLLRSTVEWGRYAGNHVLYFGLDISPALVAVGFIVGLPIAVQIFMGGAIGWLIAIPMIPVEPDQSAVEMAGQLWSTRIRYMGVGAMVVGGVVSIWRVRRGLRAAAADVLLGMSQRGKDAQVPETERNLPGRVIVAATIICLTILAGLFAWLLHGMIGIVILTTIVMLVMAFFFTAVASYIVGLVGNSNSPVSGMTITVVLVTGTLIWLFGYAGHDAILAMLGVAGVVCCTACTSGDVCNDLKTGYLVGAAPWRQQVMQLMGVAIAAFVLSPVLMVLHEGSLRQGGGGIGGRDLSAPQARLFAALANGFFGNEPLPWDMVTWGVGLGLALLAGDFWLRRIGSNFRLHVMPVAVGVYLPFGLAVPILIGGLISHFVARRSRSEPEGAQRQGVLAASGLIAGESLVGVLVGFLFFVGYQQRDAFSALANRLQLPGGWRARVEDVLCVLALAAVVAWLHRKARR